MKATSEGGPPWVAHTVLSPRPGEVECHVCVSAAAACAGRVLWKVLVGHLTEPIQVRHALTSFAGAQLAMENEQTTPHADVGDVGFASALDYTVGTIMILPPGQVVRPRFVPCESLGKRENELRKRVF